MKTSRRIWLTVAVVILAVAGFFWLGSRRSVGVADKYKAELRAKGEKLSFAELGFPRPPENGGGLARLTNAVNRIQSGGFSPGNLSLMHFVGPGQAQVCWRSSEALLIRLFNSKGYTNRMSWDELKGHLSGAADQLAEIRSAVEKPMRWFLSDPASYFNSTNWPKYPFVEMRKAANWLAADTMDALHANKRDRALKDIHALVQLAELNKHEPSLAAQMGRIAFSGLGSRVTWEALQDANWTEPELAAMQRDWERVDLLKALETGFLGERAFGEATFAEIRKNGAQRMIQKRFPPGGNSSPFKNIASSLVALAWKMNAQEDELLLFRHYQGILESIRGLQKQKPWLEARAKAQLQIDKIIRLDDELFGLRKYQYYFSFAIIPNAVIFERTTVQNETLRRLTVTAIALKRYELTHHRLPPGLADLVPEFLSVVPIDPMSGQPLRYHPNADGSFALYSVGEDGHDDGGDPNPPKPVGSYDLWSGRDAVWPVAAAGPARADN